MRSESDRQRFECHIILKKSGRTHPQDLCIRLLPISNETGRTQHKQARGPEPRGGGSSGPSALLARLLPISNETGRTHSQDLCMRVLPKWFLQANDLTAHMRSESDRQRFEATIAQRECRQRFVTLAAARATLNDLNAHMRSETTCRVAWT